MSSRERAWRGLEVIHNRYSYRELAVPAYSSHIIAVHFGHPVTLVEKINARTYESCLKQGDVTIVPAGLPSEWRCVEGEEIDVINMHLQPEFLRSVAAGVSDADPDQIEIISQLGKQDAQISYISYALRAALEDNNPASQLYAESLATALAVHLLHNYSAAAQPVRDYTSGLPTHKLRRVREYINEHLEDDLSLSDLASVSVMSPHHFARQFKQATGLSPHQYVTSRRIEQAKVLLAKTDLSITEIALRVGCASQSHLSKLFRQITGTSPKAYRRAL
jgi:AraC family transcriptional regulator